MIGQQFGRLQVIAQASGRRNWQCRCACGGGKVVRADHLRAGLIQSCGCIRSETSARRNIERRTHGHASDRARSPTYRTWQSMLTRCFNPNADNFDDYGGRGITVCERWLSFEAFLADMGERPGGTTINRLDNLRGYEPGNCQWATPVEQQNNKSDNVVIAAEGREQTMAEWAREKGLGYQTLRKRLECGWPVERALNESARR